MKMRTPFYLFLALLLNLYGVNVYAADRPSCDDCISGTQCGLFQKWRCRVNQRDNAEIQYLDTSKSNIIVRVGSLPNPLIDYSGRTIYHLFKKEKVVLSMRLNGSESPSITDMRLYKFSSMNTVSEIDDWLAGVSTDYVTYVQPVRTFSVNASEFTFTLSSMEYLERINVRNELKGIDQTLDVYQVDFVISDLFVNNQYGLKSLSETDWVYVPVEIDTLEIEL